MDAGASRPRRRNTEPAATAVDGEIDALGQRVLRLENDVAALEKALSAMGWTKQQPVGPFGAWPPPPAPVRAAPTPSAAAPLHAGPPLAAPPPARIPAAAAAAPTLDQPTAEDGLDMQVIRWVTDLGPAKILALVGGGALLLGMAYFLSLAFSRGWITPEMRVLLGLVVGFAMLPAGALLFDRERPTLGYVVVGVGLGTIDLALFGSRLYELVPAELALGGALVAALSAGVIAVRWNSQLVAGMGIAAVLAAPPIVSAPANLVTVAFLGAVLVGVAYVSFRRDWQWLPWLSFALTAPQLLQWLSNETKQPELVMVVLGGYWIVFAVSSVGPVVLGRARSLAESMLLLAAIAAFTALAAYLGFDNPTLTGAFVGALALANLATGLGLVRRRGLNDDLAQGALGLSVALYLVAAALALDGPAIPIAWSLAMVASAFVWARFGLARAAIVAVGLGAITAVHIVVDDYLVQAGHRAVQWPPPAEQVVPFADPQGVAVLVFLVGLAVCAWLSRSRVVRQAIAAGAVLLLAAIVPLEATDLAPAYESAMDLTGWTLLALVALAGDRLWEPRWSVHLPDHVLAPVGALVGALALGQLGLGYRLLDLASPVRPTGTPFANEQTIVTLVVVGAMWALALARSDQLERAGVVLLSLLVIAALLNQQLPLEWAVVGWCLIAVGIFVAAPAAGRVARAADLTAGVLLTAAAVASLAVIAPVARLVVAPSYGPALTSPPNEATIALGSLALALAVATWREEQVNGTRWLGIGVLVAVVYGLSVGLVDSFAVRVADPLAMDEIGKQAQVALTILWAALGLLLLAFGLLRDWLPGRIAGLALLGLATVKTFLYDLSALDIAYRVLSLIGLGVLLLAGAYAYQKLRSRQLPGGRAGPAAHSPT